jgi:hypothetical protein
LCWFLRASVRIASNTSPLSELFALLSARRF